MPTPIMGDIPILDTKNASLEDLRSHIGKLQDYLIQQQRDQTYLLSTLDFENIFAVGGWRVNPDRIQSKDEDVGMSTEDTAADDIRFWAGDLITGTPKFYVTKSGKLYAIDGTFVGTITADSGTIGGWVITVNGLQSSVSSYPRTELASNGNLLSAYASAARSIIVAAYTNTTGAPYMEFNDSVDQVTIDLIGSLFTILANVFVVLQGTDVDINASSGDIRIYPAYSTGKQIRIPYFDTLRSDFDGITLQDALDAKQDTISGYTGSFVAGANTVNVVDGIITSVV